MRVRSSRAVASIVLGMALVGTMLAPTSAGASGALPDAIGANVTFVESGGQNLNGWTPGGMAYARTSYFSGGLSWIKSYTVNYSWANDCWLGFAAFGLTDGPNGPMIRKGGTGEVFDLTNTYATGQCPISYRGTFPYLTSEGGLEFDSTRNEFVSRNGGTIHRYNPLGTHLGTITLSGWGSDPGETNYGDNIAVVNGVYITWNLANARISAWSRVGVRVGQATIHGANDWNGRHSFSFADGRLWVALSCWACVRYGYPITITPDTTAPVITPNVSPVRNADGWNNSNVTVNWAINEISGIQSSTGCGTQMVTTETSSQVLTCTATDIWGNTGSGSVTIKLDKTTPVIGGSASPSANGAGWNNTDVTVTFTCSDARSGVASCSEPVSLTGEGAGQSADGIAVDNAGNQAQASVGGINIDKTAPASSVTTSGLAVRSLGQGIDGTASDNLSGTVSTSVTLTDVGGTSTTVPANCTGGCGTTSSTWTVPSSALDSLLAGPYTVTAISTDAAGNVEAAGVPTLILLV